MVHTSVPVVDWKPPCKKSDLYQLVAASVTIKSTVGGGNLYIPRLQTNWVSGTYQPQWSLTSGDQYSVHQVTCYIQHCKKV